MKIIFKYEGHEKSVRCIKTFSVSRVQGILSATEARQQKYCLPSVFSPREERLWLNWILFPTSLYSSRTGILNQEPEAPWDYLQETESPRCFLCVLKGVPVWKHSEALLCADIVDEDLEVREENQTEGKNWVLFLTDWGYRRSSRRTCLKDT